MGKWVGSGLAMQVSGTVGSGWSVWVSGPEGLGRVVWVSGPGWDGPFKEVGLPRSGRVAQVSGPVESGCAGKWARPGLVMRVRGPFEFKSGRAAPCRHDG